MTGNNLYDVTTTTVQQVLLTLMNPSNQDKIYRVDINDKLYKLVYIKQGENVTLDTIGEVKTLRVTDIYEEED